MIRRAVLVFALAVPCSASASVLGFDLDPPLSIFSGEFGLFASTSYIETIADGSPCWWEFVDDYNRLPQPSTPSYVTPSPPYVPPIVIPSPPPPVAVPEPSTWLLFSIGLALISFGRPLMRRVWA